MTPRLLVAGIGNIFLSDDGFGVEVIRRLGDAHVPDEVRVVDFGIRGIHLAYELSSGYDAAILIDAAPRGGAPGTLYVIEPDLSEPVSAGDPVTMADAHSLDPVAVLALLRQIGGSVARIVIVGCEPATIEDGIGLSAPVEAAIDGAAALVLELIAEMLVAPPAELVGG